MPGKIKQEDRVIVTEDESNNIADLSIDELQNYAEAFLGKENISIEEWLRITVAIQIKMMLLLDNIDDNVNML